MYAPVAKGRPVYGANPVTRSLPNGDVAVTHKVLLYRFAYAGPSVVLAKSITINPGLSQFQWVSRMAALYETYSINSMRIEYASSTTTQASGKMYMYFDPDAKDASLTTPEEFSNQAKNVSCLIWQDSLKMNIPPTLMRRSNGQKLFVRSDTDVPQGDITLYDAGILHLLMEPTILANVAPETLAGLNIGEIWAYYTISFHTPSTSTPGPSVLAAPAAVTQYQTSEDTAVTGSPTQPTVMAIIPTADSAPVVDNLALGPFDPLTGATIKNSGVYAVKVSLDAGDSEGGLESPASEVNVESVLTVESPGELPSILNTTAVNSTTLQDITNPINWAENNASVVYSFLAGEIVNYFNIFGPLVGNALLKKGASVGFEYLAALSPTQVQAVKRERKKLTPVSEYLAERKAIYGRPTAFPSPKPRKVPASKATPIPPEHSSDVRPDDEDLPVRTDKDGRTYVIVRPATVLRSEVRSYVD